MSQEEHDRRIDYVEFETTDIEQSKNFYTTVFDWKFTDWGEGYTSFADPDGNVLAVWSDRE
jgi:predicted enzyme related to lactoylglutathione lyase